MSEAGPTPFSERHPPALVPRYITPAPNEPIPFPVDQLGVQTESGLISTVAKVSLEWTPFPHIELVATGLPFDPPVEPPLALFPPELKIQAVLLNWISSKKTLDRVETRWIADPGAPGSLPPCRSVTFHLVSFPEYIGSPISGLPAGEVTRLGRATFDLGEFHCTIDPIMVNEGWYKSAPRRTNGQFVITHCGRVERIDGAELNSDGMEEALTLLWLVLSFYRGAWVSPTLLSGHDASGDLQWECWRVGRMDARPGTGSWRFDLAQELLGFVGGLANRMGSEVWREPIKTAIHWYVECNTSNNDPEGAIILQQAAFESLAWTLLVEDRGVLSEKGATALAAADKIRLLLSDCGIPMSIPPSLTDLTAAGRKFNWPDGPAALTEVRNALVHANPKKRAKMHKAGPHARIDAYRLGQWYLELVLLRLFDYRGQYSNRLLRGVSRAKTIERVPWSTGSP